MWNQILVYSNSLKMSFLPFWRFWTLILVKLSNFQIPNLPKIQTSECLKLPKMTFLDCLNSSKFDFTLNLSGGKMKNDQILKKPSLNFTFRKFLEHSASLFIMFATSGTNCWKSFIKVTSKCCKSCVCKCYMRFLQ